MSDGGSEANAFSIRPAYSADGRYVAFSSWASNLVLGDTNSATDIFVYDLQTSTIERVSIDSSGNEADGGSDFSSLSGDGRYVAFVSWATTLVASDTNARVDVFVRDRIMNTTERVSITDGGGEANSDSIDPDITPDGRYVAFSSVASNLVPGDSNGASDVFVYDRTSDTIERVSLSTGGVQGNQSSEHPHISDDGRYVSFISFSSNLVPGDTNSTYDVFVYDRTLDTCKRVSVDSGGGQANSFSQRNDISGNGLFVVFDSLASNLVAGDTNSQHDVFVFDLLSNNVERVSVDSSGNQANTGSWISDRRSAISSDGRFIAFMSSATNLVVGDTNGYSDIFVHDRVPGWTARVSLDSSGNEGNGESRHPAISANTGCVAFYSEASNLVSSDTNVLKDVFAVCDFLSWVTRTVTPSVTATWTLTVTPTSSATPTLTISGTLTHSATFTPTGTWTPSFTLTPTPTISATLTSTATISTTYTVSPTPSITPTVTPTYTLTPLQGIHVWPNPFDPSKAYGGVLKAETLPDNSILKIFTISGELVDEILPVNGRAEWDGRNENGRNVSPGTYYYLIQNGKETLKAGKIVLVR